jgi:hypothetical protein
LGESAFTIRRASASVPPEMSTAFEIVDLQLSRAFPIFCRDQCDLFPPARRIYRRAWVQAMWPSERKHRDATRADFTAE